MCRKASFSLRDFRCGAKGHKSQRIWVTEQVIALVAWPV